MKLRHAVALVVMVTGLFTVGGASALAAYPPSTGNGTLSNSVVTPGQAATFCGGGYAPGSTVVVTVDGAFYRSVTANGSGSFCASVRMSSAGTHTLRARGVTSSGQVRTVSAMLIVRSGAVSGADNEASGSSDDGSLPFTGAEVGLMAAGAALLLGAGVGARYAGRRRRSTTA